jgi:hypothetical protein
MNVTLRNESTLFKVPCNDLILHHGFEDASVYEILMKFLLTLLHQFSKLQHLTRPQIF